MQLRLGHGNTLLGLPMYVRHGVLLIGRLVDCRSHYVGMAKTLMCTYYVLSDSSDISMERDCAGEGGMGCLGFWWLCVKVVECLGWWMDRWCRG